jgi:hypothetical protein
MIQSLLGNKDLAIEKCKVVKDLKGKDATRRFLTLSIKLNNNLS